MGKERECGGELFAKWYFDSEEEGCWIEQVVGLAVYGKYYSPVGRGGDKHVESINALLETSGTDLVYANPNDRVLGIGYGPADAAGNEGAWGDNLFGKALMKIRDDVNEDGERKLLVFLREMAGRYTAVSIW